jgi:hypothetical protein
MVIALETAAARLPQSPKAGDPFLLASTSAMFSLASILLLAFVLGMRHATDAVHVVAGTTGVASVAFGIVLVANGIANGLFSAFPRWTPR